MRELANYSIETDQLVWLSFKDGHSLRVGVNQLPQYLSPRDLQKVRKAMKLRRDFFRDHMPKTLVAVAGVGMAALLVATGPTVAFLRQTEVDTPESPPTEIVRNQNTEEVTGVATPVPAPVESGVAGVVVPPPATPTPKPKPNRRSSKASPAKPGRSLPGSVLGESHSLEKDKTPDTPIYVPDILDLETTPDPQPQSTPQIVPTPEPIPTPPGQVLGDGTGPDATPTPPVPAQ